MGCSLDCGTAGHLRVGGLRAPRPTRYWAVIIRKMLFASLCRSWVATGEDVIKHCAWTCISWSVGRATARRQRQRPAHTYSVPASATPAAQSIYANRRRDGAAHGQIDHN